MTPNPKKKPIRLSAYGLRRLKEDLYCFRAYGRCETCGDPVPLKADTIFECAHLSHIKSRGSGGDDSPENCLIEDYKCHIAKRHGPRWSEGNK